MFFLIRSLHPEDEEEDTTAIVSGRHNGNYRDRQTMQLQRYHRSKRHNRRIKREMNPSSLLPSHRNASQSTEFLTGPVDGQGYQVPLPFHEIDISDEAGYDVPMTPTGPFHAHSEVHEYRGILAEYAVVNDR